MRSSPLGDGQLTISRAAASLTYTARCTLVAAMNSRRKGNDLKIPGLTLAVLRNGKLLLVRSYGLARVEPGVPLRPGLGRERGHDRTRGGINGCITQMTRFRRTNVTMIVLTNFDRTDIGPLPEGIHTLVTRDLPPP
jgi:hypothetical protein